MALSIRPADFGDPRLHRFLDEHLSDLAPTAPPESRHALDLTGLQAPGVRLWVAHADDRIVGTAALAPLAPGQAEIKSMRTAPEYRGQGIASRLLRHVLDHARGHGIGQVWLETGSMEFFAPAHAMYRKHGFTDCEPFGSYRPDPNSTFMTMTLSPRSPEAL